MSGRRAAAARGALALLLGAALLLSACRPLYLPVIPEAPPYAPPSRVAASEATLSADGRPQLDLTLAGVEEGGWLAVQWMAPSGREAASQSVWVEAEGASEGEAEGEAADRPVAVRFTLPADVEATPGEWRAVVSLGGKLLRQYTFLLD